MLNGKDRLKIVSIIQLLIKKIVKYYLHVFFCTHMSLNILLGVSRQRGIVYPFSVIIFIIPYFIITNAIDEIEYGTTKIVKSYRKPNSTKQRNEASAYFMLEMRRTG